LLTVAGSAEKLATTCIEATLLGEQPLPNVWQLDQQLTSSKKLAIAAIFIFHLSVFGAVKRD